jgi:hypothetical protein
MAKIEETATAAPETGAERRSQLRQRVLKGATIRFNKGYGALECVVRNLSENGARLSFGETTGVPAAFELKIAGGERLREAQIRWRTPDSVGVLFARDLNLR